MDGKELTNNPFVALFKNVDTAKSYAEGAKFGVETAQLSYPPAICCDVDSDEKDDLIEIERKKPLKEESHYPNKSTPLFNKEVAVNDFLQQIFLITVDFKQQQNDGFLQLCDAPNILVKLNDLQEECQENSRPCLLTPDCMSHALYERLQMLDPSNCNAILVQRGYNGNWKMDPACDKCLIQYLAACYCRIHSFFKFFSTPLGKRIITQEDENFEKELHNIAEDCKKLVISYTGTILLQPGIFPVNEPHAQFLNVLTSGYTEPHLYKYAEALIQSYSNSEDLATIFLPVLDHMWKHSERFAILHPDVFPLLNTLIFFSINQPLAWCLVKSKYWLPHIHDRQFRFVLGSSFEHETILGRFLRITSIPLIQGAPSEHFLKPSQQSEAEMSAVTDNIRQYLDTLVNMIHKLLHNLLQTPNMQHEILMWIGLCLNANEKRSQMYADPATVADSGFFLNLTHVLLKFCEPFSSPECKLLLKVDCRYSVVSCTPESVIKSDTSIHVVGLEKYTPMAPEPDETSRILVTKDVKFNFISEIFFLTHLCFKLGFVKMYDQYEELMKRLRKLSNVYQDAQRQGNIEGVIENFKNDFENGIRTQLAAKAHLLNPTFSDLSLKFSITTGHWLVQQVLAGKDYMVTEQRTLKPDLLTNDIPPALTIIPEFIAENVGDTLRSLGNFNEETLERCDLLKYGMNFFAVFLGAKCRIKNPHLRAKLAECLAAFLPKDKPGLSGTNHFSFSYRKKAFELSADVIKILPRSLLQLFVDIEFTGHTMEFDQKFMYRRYMYSVLEYIWQIPSYLSVFKSLHKHGIQMYKQEKYLSSFPRFINLLVNDSTFLLDEALQNIVTIRELEKEKANGEWENLSDQEKADKEKNLRQCGHMAEGYNTMAKETVHVITYITKEIDRPFVSHVMADSMAAFLNYFFVHLVGPKRKQLKVNDFEKYNFDPGHLVKNITTIYLQLAKHDDFCQAIVKDTRSYSPALFASAVDVLDRLDGAHELADQLRSLSHRLEEWCEKHSKAESEMPELPEEFIDPISCELMQEPVKLPSSGQIVCRSTIAKHLLSDEKDPFNRSPLQLDQVIPCDELQKKIKEWMEDNFLEPPLFTSD